MGLYYQPQLIAKILSITNHDVIASLTLVVHMRGILQALQSPKV